MVGIRHRAIPVTDGFEVYASDRKVAQVGFGSARNDGELRALLAAMDRIHGWAAEVTARGEGFGPFRLKRDTSLAGARTWSVREDRDPLVHWMECPRSLLDYRAPSGACELLRVVEAVVAHVRATFREVPEPQPRRDNVLAFVR